MKKNVLLGAGVVMLVLVILFVVLKPKAPDFGAIAVVTENDNAVIPLPELGEDISRYRLQPGSQLLWTGRKIGGFHYGTVDVSQGAIVLNDAGDVVAGKFIMTMDSIAIADMSSDNPLYNQLLNHLRDGFFAVDEHPHAAFDLKKTEKKSGSMYTVVGNLQLKGVTREITFPAEIVIQDNEVTVKANFFIDRTAWGIDEVIQIADKYIELALDFVFERL